MKQINPEHIDGVIRLTNDSPYFLLLSMKISEISAGYSKLIIDLEEKHMNPYGGVHGGVYASIIDAATYWAVYCAVPADVGMTSLDLHVDDISTVQKGRLIVEGRQVKAGRTICLAEATIKNEDGKLLAFGTSKQMVSPDLPTMDRAAEAMGKDPLPPKFL